MENLWLGWRSFDCKSFLVNSVFCADLMGIGMRGLRVRALG